MSEKDRFDWSDDADFESLADEPIDGFADFEDGDDYDSMADDRSFGGSDPVADHEDVEATSPGNGEAPEKQREPVRVSPRRGRGISSGELAVLFSASTLVAAAGIGSASLLAVGVNPLTLWQPGQFLQWENYFNLQSHPLNILALICLGVIALTLLGSRAIAKAAGAANMRARAAEEMLDRVTSLRLEKESAWQDPAFKAFGPANMFVAETLGAWRLQAARQNRMTGLEGELHRLEKALADNSREDLGGRFDNPTVGTLADEMTRHMDERATQARELAAVRDKDQLAAGELVQILQDARCWHDASERNLGLQGASVDRLASRLQDLIAEMDTPAGDVDPSAVLDECKDELDRIRTSVAKAPAGNTDLNDLVDKSSKLAFQIAMEVARLGPRGERLVPMSQSLEDLTTEFRSAADRADAKAKPGQQWSDSLDRLARKLADMESAIQGGGSDWRQQVSQWGPAARQLADNLSEIVQSYQPQAERLTNLGSEFAEFSGADFDPADLSSGNPENPPAGVLNIEGRTPFSDDEQAHNEGGIHQPADVDPFAVTPPPRVVEAPADPDFSSSVGDPEADVFGSGMDRDNLPELEIESSFGITRDDAAAGDKGAESGDDKVYDLADFGAAPTSVPAAGETPEPETDEVFEMEDLGATPLAAPAPAPASAPAPAEPAEQVYDLAEFGALALDTPAADPEEEVYDLNDFGAVLLA